MVHTISNNIYTTLFCRDTSKKSKTPKLDFVLQLLIKFISAVIPIAAALSISNLVYVLKYAGLIGFFISFFFPTALQLSSTWRCSTVFATGDKIRGTTSPTLKDDKAYHLQNSSEMSERKCLKSRISQMFASYQTPYSNRFLSHPIVVSVIGVVGVLLFLLSIGSLAVHPKQLHCSSKP